MKNGHFTRKVKTSKTTKDNQPMVTTESNIHNVWTSVKQLTNALRYFQDAVEKEIHNQLPGASSILLDIVVSCYTQLGAYLINKDRNAKMLSATDRVYISLAELMKWSDRVLIEETSSYDRDDVRQIVSNLKESVNTLVQLCVDSYQSRDNLVKSSTSFSLKNDETYGNNNNNNNININCNNNNSDDNGDINKTNGNTQVKPDTVNGSTFIVGRKATNHSDHFSLSHHRNSLPELNPTQSANSSSFSSSSSTSSSSSSGTTPSTVKTCNIRHQLISVTSATPTLSTTTTTTSVAISTLTDKLTSTYHENRKDNLTDDQKQFNNLTIYPASTISGIYNKTSSAPPPPTTTASSSDRFPHSLSTDSLLNSKFNDHLKMTIPMNSNNNFFYNFNMPGGKRGGIIVNNNTTINNPIQFTNSNQINSFTSSGISTSSSSSSTAGPTDYLDFSDIPPPLPPKKKLSSELIKIQPKRPSLANQNPNEFIVKPNSSLSSAFNCHSHHAMSLESFSNLMISDCPESMAITSSSGQDISQHHDYRTMIGSDAYDSSQNVYSSQTSSTRTLVHQSNRPAINIIRDSRSSKDGQSINNEDLFPLPSELLINMNTYDYAVGGESGQPSPPELPVKLRRRNHQQLTNEILRPPSQYDNISDVDSVSTPTSTNNDSVYKYDWSSSTWKSSNHSISCPMHLSRQADSISSNDHSTSSNYGEDDGSRGGDGGHHHHHHIYEDFTKPPPLPPKQRNIMTYMTMLNNGKTYDAPNDAVLNLYRHSVHTYHLINSASKLYSWQQLESTFNSQMKKISSTANSEDSFLSLESNAETSSSTANLSYQRISAKSDHFDDKPPSLPPKARSQIHLSQFNSFNQYQQHQQHHYNYNLNQQPILPQVQQQQFKHVTQIENQKQQQIESQFPESQPVTNIETVQIDENESHELPPPPLPPSLEPQPPLTQEKTSSPVAPPTGESGISSQSESIRTIDECQGPLDEIDVSPYLVYKNPDDDGPEIRGGIVDVLIVKATEVSKNDFLFQEAFLTTYRTFINPMELINKLIYRYNKFTNCTDSKQRAAKNSFALLVRVVDDLCVSDCSDLLMQTLLEFTYSLVIKGDLAFARVLRVKVIEKFDNRRNGNLPVVNPILLPSIGVSKHTSLHSFKSEIVAEQMTLVDAGLFQKVEVAEYLLWAREQKEELIPNLNKFTEHFNKMSYWARSRIVEIDDPKEREKLVTKFIKIMKHLRKMNNFNSYLALLSALDSGPVRRLEWPKSITESLKDLCSLIDSSSSFRAYRQALAETQPPCIPYIGLILQDLTFVHIGNSDFLSDSAGNNINFAKRWQIFNILDQMRRFKNSHYPFKKNEQVLTFFSDFDNFLCEEAIWQISETIKPRLNGSSNVNSSPEKSTNTKK